MANGPLVRRLMMAGASPQRAQQFAQQYAQSVAARTGSRAPQDIQDAFDKDLGALSEAYFPNAFRPPTIDNPQLNDYISFIYGPNKLADLETQVYSKNAPAFFKAKQAGGYEATLAALIENGASLQQINKVITDDYNNKVLTTADFPVTNPNIGVTQSASAYANKLFNQYYNAKGKIDAAKADFLSKDKYYAAGLPHPKLTYGYKTDLAQGIIGIETLGPKVQQYVSDKVRSAIGTGAGADRAGRLADQIKQNALDELLGKVNQRKGSPFTDEVKRRESLKDKSLLPPRP